MPNFSSLTITIRPSYLFASTIIGFARLVWHFREFIERAIIDDFKKKRNGTMK